MRLFFMIFLMLSTSVGAKASQPGARLPHAGPQALRTMVEHHAAANGVPSKVGHAIVKLESSYRPGIVHRGNYGLMQIRYGTARAMGYEGGPSGLLNAATNLRFGMKYFGRAWRANGGDLCRAIAQYQTGHTVTVVPPASRVYCQRARKIIAGL